MKYFSLSLVTIASALIMSCNDDTVEAKVEPKPALAVITYEIINRNVESVKPQTVKFYLNIDRISTVTWEHTDAFDSTFTIDIKEAAEQMLIIKKIPIADANIETLSICGGVHWPDDNRSYGTCGYWEGVEAQTVCRLYSKW